MTHRKLIAPALVAVAVTGWTSSWPAAGGTPPLPLESGSLLAVAAFAEPKVLVEFSATGDVLGTIDIVDPAGIVGSPSGLTRLGGDLWVGGESSVHRLDPATGEIFAGFAVSDGPTLTALTNDGEFLLVGEFVVDAFDRFDTSGAPIGTIALDTPNLFMVGADSDGIHIYVGSHATGDVHVFDMTGTTVDVIDIDLPSDLTGVALGPDGETLWVATGVGTNEIHRFDFDGNLVATFPGQFSGIMGLVTLNGEIFADGFESGSTDAWSATVD